MNPDKARLKMSVLHELGVGFDDMLERAQRDEHEAVGASRAFRIAVSQLPQVFDIVKQDMDSGELSKVIDDGPLAVHGYVNKQLTRCVEICKSLLMSAERKAIELEGRTAQAKITVQALKKNYDQERDRLNAFVAAAARESSPTDELSNRPDERSSAAQELAQRRAEARKEKEEASSPQVEPPDEPNEQKRVRKRR